MPFHQHDIAGLGKTKAKVAGAAAAAGRASAPLLRCLRPRCSCSAIRHSDAELLPHTVRGARLHGCLPADGDIASSLCGFPDEIKPAFPPPRPRVGVSRAPSGGGLWGSVRSAWPNAAARSSRSLRRSAAGSGLCGKTRLCRWLTLATAAHAGDENNFQAFRARRRRLSVGTR